MLDQTNCYRTWRSFYDGLDTKKTQGKKTRYVLDHLDLLDEKNIAEMMAGFREISWLTCVGKNLSLMKRLLFAKDAADRLTPEKIKNVYDKRWLGVYDDPKSGTARAERMRFYLVNSKIYEIPETVFSLVLTQTLMDIFKNYIDPGSTVIEMGCGSGRNIFMLKKMFPELRCYGYDISTAGIQAAIRFAEGLKMREVCFTELDITDSDRLASLAKEIPVERRVVISVGALEGIKYHTPQVLKNILSLEPHLVIHYEPVFELYKDGFLSRDYFCRKRLILYDYQQSLLSNLQRLEKESKIKILECRRLGLGKVLLESSLIVWKPSATM